MKLKNVFFLFIPFLFFWIGYLSIGFFTTSFITVPSLKGLSLEQALIILSKNSLNARIIKEVENNNLPAGLILSQLPSAGQRARTHQTVLLTINKHIDYQKVPSFLEKPIPTIEQEARLFDIPLKIYWLKTSHPPDLCIAQFPSPAQLKPSDSEVIIYGSINSSTLVFMPNFHNFPLQDVLLFLSKYGITPQIFNSTPFSSNSLIQEQWPAAGALFDLNKPPLIQLKLPS